MQSLAEIVGRRPKDGSDFWGRFLQTDPVRYGDGPNIYAYVRGDPVNGTDPEGTDMQAVLEEFATWSVADDGAGARAEDGGSSGGSSSVSYGVERTVKVGICSEDPDNSVCGTGYRTIIDPLDTTFQQAILSTPGGGYTSGNGGGGGGSNAERNCPSASPKTEHPKPSALERGLSKVSKWSFAVSVPLLGMAAVDQALPGPGTIAGGLSGLAASGADLIGLGAGGGAAVLGFFRTHDVSGLALEAFQDSVGKMSGLGHFGAAGEFSKSVGGAVANFLGDADNNTGCPSGAG